MGKSTGFLDYPRVVHGSLPVATRVKNYAEFTLALSEAELGDQGARCMDCGVPFCHTGCPINNVIPEWNDLVYQGRWMDALTSLSSTNNFPEFTGRICPAPCEEACTLNLTGQPVAIKDIELAIVEKGFKEGWIKPRPAPHRTGKKVAVVGAGPAGMASAQQLARAGHDVTLFEKNKKPGGLLRYGIPDFKLGKDVIDRRIAQMRAEGVVIRTGTHVGLDVKAAELMDGFDAILLTGGSEKPRDLPIPGRELSGVHFALEFLTQSNRRVSGEGWDGAEITAAGKHVVVIGGGDTGSDCVGTSNRQGAASVTQVEIMPKPPEHEDKDMVWPLWPMKLRTSSSHEEGCERLWSVTAQNIEGENGAAKRVNAIRVDAKLNPIAGEEFVMKADLVLLAMGFVHPVHEGLIADLDLAKDGRGNVAASDVDYQTSVKKVFAAGDMRRGQSLVVWAINEGRRAAASVDRFLRT